MYISTALVGAVALIPLISAHDGAAIPKVYGLNTKDLKARNLLSNWKLRAAEVNHEGAEMHENVERRQTATGQCGAAFGSCAAGVCCSEAGWCGTDPDYCYSPGCNYQYGPGCPENVTPAGTNTSTVARTKVGSVPYGGAGIYSCVQAGTVALTYDDGPFPAYTAHILDVFKSYNGKATFFITGNNINKGEIDTTAEFNSVIQRMYTEGHQIASHTWTHLDLSAISAAERNSQMYKNEMALRNILGFFPTYMRPPYSSCTAASGCEQAMADLGYHVTYFDVDTDDYNQDSPTAIQNSKNNFIGNITAGSASAATDDWLTIGHDIHEQTAYNLTEYMLSTLTQLGYRAVTVGECLGDPAANWYRSSAAGEGNVSTSTALAPTSSTSTRTSSAPTSSTSAPTSSTPTSSSSTSTGTSSARTSSTSTGTSSARTSSTSTGTSSARTSSTSTRTSSVLTSSTSTRTSSAPASTGTQAVSTDATCGGPPGLTCQGSTFGNCCSSAGWCGSTAAYCGTGCQSGYGTCTSNSISSSAVSVSSTRTTSTSKAPTTSTIATRTTSSAPATSTKVVSTDGTCAGTGAFTCQGSSFGNCCSQYGWCGTTTGHCGTGCNAAFGTCT